MKEMPGEGGEAEEKPVEPEETAEESQSINYKTNVMKPKDLSVVQCSGYYMSSSCDRLPDVPIQEANFNKLF